MRVQSQGLSAVGLPGRVRGGLGGGVEDHAPERVRQRGAAVVEIRRRGEEREPHDVGPVTAVLGRQQEREAVHQRPARHRVEGPLLGPNAAGQPEHPAVISILSNPVRLTRQNAEVIGAAGRGGRHGGRSLADAPEEVEVGDACPDACRDAVPSLVEGAAQAP